MSSQWDGLRHFGYQKEAKFYNGVTLDDIHAKDSCGKKATVNGIQGQSGRPLSPPTGVSSHEHRIGPH